MTAKRPYMKKHKYNYFMEDCDVEDTPECDDNTDCPTDPDLLLLRQNAKGEREAIAFYLHAASMTTGPLCQLFMHTAKDEMVHFRNTMTLLAKYDPIQAQAFNDVGIVLPVDEARKMTPAPCPEDKQEVIDLLTKAITDELDAINMYQLSYEKACHDDVKALFCANGNDEKHHVAEFWKALMTYTKEKVPTAKS